MASLTPLQKILFVLMMLYSVVLNLSLGVTESLNTLFILFGLGAFAYHAYKKDISLKSVDTFQWLALAFFISVFAANFFGPNELNFKKTLLDLRWILIMFSIAYILGVLSDRTKRFIRVFIATAMLVGLYSIFCSLIGEEYSRPDIPMHHLTLGGDKVYRVRGLFSHVMSYAYMVGIPLMVLAAASLERPFRGKQRWYVFGLYITMLTIILTYTRGAWLSAIIATLLVTAVKNRKLFIKFTVFMVFALISISIVFPEVRTRLSQIVYIKSSVSNRFKLWNASYHMFRDYPLTGIGWRQNKKHTPEYKVRLYGTEGFVSDAHSNYLEVLGGGGIIVFLLWISLFGYLLIMSLQMFWRSKTHWQSFIAMSAFGSHVFFHLGGLSQSSFFDKEPLYAYIFICALFLHEHRKSLQKT